MGAPVLVCLGVVLGLSSPGRHQPLGFSSYLDGHVALKPNLAGVVRFSE